MKAEADIWLEFLEELLRLKAVPRTGWLLRGLRTVESVADHSYGVAFIAMMLADRVRAAGQAVNVETVLRMALLHDLTEARTGDLPATIKRYFEQSALHHADEQAATEMLAPLGAVGQAYLAVRREYEARQSLEARLVKAADKLDLLLQARAYEKSGAQSLQEFWQNSEIDFSSLGLEEWIVDLVEVLKASRKPV